MNMIKIRRVIMSNLAAISSTMLYTAFAFYSIATIMFGVTIKDNKKDKNKQKKKGLTGTIAISLTIIGLITQVGYFITRRSEERRVGKECRAKGSAEG